IASTALACTPPMKPSPIQGIRSATSGGAWTQTSSALNASATAAAAAIMCRSASPPDSGAMILAQSIPRPPLWLFTPHHAAPSFDICQAIGLGARRLPGEVTLVARPPPPRRRNTAQPRAWQRMLSGRPLDRPDHRGPCLLGGPALVRGRGDRGARPPRTGAALAPGRAAARCAGIRDRRHDLAVQRRARVRLSHLRGTTGGG